MTSWTHVHIKSNKPYRLLHFAKIEKDLEPVIVYQAEDGTVWVRPLMEFVERFRPIEGKTVDECMHGVGTDAICYVCDGGPIPHPRVPSPSPAIGDVEKLIELIEGADWIGTGHVDDGIADKNEALRLARALAADR